MRAIEYLSPPAQVSMGDRWFDISPIGHFWVRRRFEIFRTLAGSVLQNSKHIAEIGCGHGLVQRQIEEAYGKEVTGFDLNEIALKQNQSQRSSVCCYDICQRAPQFRHRFDCVVMFDVLEHIDDEDRFLQAVMFHLAPGGYLVVNVPAGQWLYSAYDQVDGHKRRYSIGQLECTVERNGYALVRSSYWGLPLVPVLMLRKIWLARSYGDANAVAVGFDSRNKGINRMLGWLSGCEIVPQKLLGTSVMA
ncbi:MAG: class I SAM-dependent methyltransferase, partial [Candidatus Acidiferrales bacterium]